MLKYLMIFILSLPKIIYINFKLFDFKTALKFPLLISYRTKIGTIPKGTVKIDNPSFAKVRFDFFDGTLGITPNKGLIHISKESKVHFKGKANLARGAALRVEGGTLVVGNNFACNANSFISCSEKIEIGDDNLWGWEIKIRDSDGHKILDRETEQYLADKSPVLIGKKVWLGAQIHVLKGSVIPNENVVGYGSLVSKRFEKENAVIGGHPAKIIKENIEWEH